MAKDSESSVFSMGAEPLGGFAPYEPDRFANITELYVSRSGPAMLMSATRYGKRYVLKGLRPEFRETAVYRAALRKEFEIGMSMDHPNIRNTLGFEEIEGLGGAIVMEYVDGETLDRLLDRSAISPRSGRLIASQLAAALGYVHRKQIFHRDVKPANVMVTHSGDVVKIIDFSLSDGDTFMMLKTTAGTPSYMDPRQREAGARPDASADIYSFGMTLRDIAASTGDKALLRVAEACTDPDPARRPSSFGAIALPAATEAPERIGTKPTLLASPGTTAALLAIICGLAALILFLLNP